MAVLHQAGPSCPGPWQPAVTHGRALSTPHLDLVTQLQLPAPAPALTLPLCELPTETQHPGRDKLGPRQLLTLTLQWPSLSDDGGNPSSRLTTNMKQAAAFTAEPGQCRVPH